ncbi:MAG: hypothetical protein RL650_124 [Pseudomonadota bacterium]|jgi:hypothetical protein
MRSLNIEELNEVQGGRLSGGLAVSILGLISDAFTLVEAALNVNYTSLASGSAVDYSGFNAMGDYSNGMCSR